MKLIIVCLILTASVLIPELRAQETPVLYFCEEYNGRETNISDVFTTGYLTVMVKSGNPIGYNEVEIEIDKYNFAADKFEFVKTIPFTIKKTMDYVYFQDKDKLTFETPGFYRVLLTTPGGTTKLASALIRIISG